MKSTTPLKSTGEHKYYDNGWKGNQYVKTDNVFNKNVMKNVANGAWGVGTALDVMEIYDGYQKDGQTIGKNTVKETSGIVGSIGGAFLGAEGGAIAGATLGSVIPVVGTAVGSFIGGAIGAFAGSWGGEALFEGSVDLMWSEE